MLTERQVKNTTERMREIAGYAEKWFAARRNLLHLAMNLAEEYDRTHDSWYYDMAWDAIYCAEFSEDELPEEIYGVDIDRPVMVDVVSFFSDKLK